MNNDWAIILINEKRNSHYFGFSSSPKKGMTLKLAGFHGDFNGYLGVVENNCSVVTIYSSTLYHNCDATRGASGAPIYKCGESGCHVYGIHVGADRDGTSKSLQGIKYSSKYANVALKTTKFYKKVNELRELYLSLIHI